MQFENSVFFTNVKDSCIIGGKVQVIILSLINNPWIEHFLVDIF